MLQHTWTVSQKRHFQTSDHNMCLCNTCLNHIFERLEPFVASIFLLLLEKTMLFCPTVSHEWQAHSFLTHMAYNPYIVAFSSPASKKTNESWLFRVNHILCKTKTLAIFSPKDAFRVELWTLQQKWLRLLPLMARTLSNCNLASLAPQETSSKTQQVNMKAASRKLKYVNYKLHWVTGCWFYVFTYDLRLYDGNKHYHVISLNCSNEDSASSICYY